MSSLEEARSIREDAARRRRAAGADAQAEAALSAQRRRARTADPTLARRRALAEEMRVARREVDSAFTQRPHSHARAHSVATADTHSHKPSVTKSSVSDANGNFECRLCNELKTDNMALIPCGHCNLCRECLKTWFDIHKTCPFCRRIPVGTMQIYPG